MLNPHLFGYGRLHADTRLSQQRRVHVHFVHGMITPHFCAIFKRATLHSRPPYARQLVTNLKTAHPHPPLNEFPSALERIIRFFLLLVIIIFATFRAFHGTCSKQHVPHSYPKRTYNFALCNVNLRTPSQLSNPLHAITTYAFSHPLNLIRAPS